MEELLTKTIEQVEKMDFSLSNEKLKKIIEEVEQDQKIQELKKEIEHLKTIENLFNGKIKIILPEEK